MKLTNDKRQEIVATELKKRYGNELEEIRKSISKEIEKNLYANQTEFLTNLVGEKPIELLHHQDHVIKELVKEKFLHESSYCRLNYSYAMPDRHISKQVSLTFSLNDCYWLKNFDQSHVIDLVVPAKYSKDEKIVPLISNESNDKRVILLCEEYIKWTKAESEFRKELLKLLFSVNTKKQLVDLVPEMDIHFINEPTPIKNNLVPMDLIKNIRSNLARP